MFCLNLMILAILIPSITAINMTNLGNQQDILDLRKDLTMLRNMMLSLNVSVQATLNDKERKISDMNATIQTQQQEIVLMNSTNQAQQHEIASLKAIFQAQQHAIASQNVTIQALQHAIASQNMTIQAQQHEIASHNMTIQVQHHAIISQNVTIQVQQHEIEYLWSSLNSSRENSTATNRMLSEVEEKVNQNYAAYQLIIQDLVTNFNTLRNTSQIQISRMNESVGSIASQIHYISLSFLDAQKMLRTLENSFKDVTKTISFTVSSSLHLSDYHNKIIVYDKVITNIGHAYSNDTGIFTCTTAGTYVFTWSTMSGSASQTCFAYIYHNGNRLLISHSYEANGGYDEVASNTIVLSLAVDDRVWIQTGTGTYCYGYPYTGFSGWKI